MSELARGVVIAHSSLAQALVDAADRIAGQPGALAAVSNSGLGPEDIARRVEEAAGTGPAVLFVDMPCGSCFFAAMKLERARTNVRVVTGVNLPMLLDFVHNRALTPTEIVGRVAGKGAESIRHP